MSEHIVIVGAGLAGHRAAATLRNRGFAGALTIVGDETHRPYDRPPLSKNYLAGTFEHENIYFKPEVPDVDWRLGTGAAGLDLEAKVLTLAGGEEVSYDTLIIATGRRARPWPGESPAEGVFTLRTLDDSVALRDAVTPDSRVAIVGAGFIGSEAAATMHGLGVTDISLIDIAPAPITPLGPELGRRVADAHESRGIKLHMGGGVAGLRGDARAEGVELNDGTVVEADVILLALGSLPNTEWLAESGLTLERGSVVVDAHLFAAGRDDVLAVGDVAAWPDPLSDGHLTVEHWTNAREMASRAANNILAEPAERQAYAGVPQFWSDIFDLKIKSCGSVTAADRIEIIEDPDDSPALVAEAYAGDVLTGAVTINRPRKMIEYTRQFLDQHKG